MKRSVVRNLEVETEADALGGHCALVSSSMLTQPTFLYNTGSPDQGGTPKRGLSPPHESPIKNTHLQTGQVNVRIFSKSPLPK